MLAGFETVKKPNETAKKKPKTQNVETEQRENKQKRQKSRQPAISIAVADFER